MHTIEQLRQDARGAFDAAVRAVHPANLIPAAVRSGPEGVSLFGLAIPEVRGRRVLAALGKAAPTLARAWLAQAPDWAAEVFVLTPHGVPVAPEVAAVATVARGAHPYPDADGEASARRLLALADGLGEHDLLVVLLSGGTSALIAAPAGGLELDDLHTTTRELMHAGAPIQDLNTVRRQLLAAGGGGLARTAWPARVRTLVLSDVLGDPLPDIASGPTVPSPTGPGDALEILQQFGVRDAVPPAVTAFLEALDTDAEHQDHSWVANTRTDILAGNATAVEAAASYLRERDYEVVVDRRPLVGEAAERGRQLGAIATSMRPAGLGAVVVGGETTVTVRGTGRGGRNQELALAAATAIADRGPVVLLAGGTDGIDGASEHAGAVVDPGTVSRLRAAGFDPEQVLADNDSGTALAAVGDAIVTGPTGTNVCDVTMVLSAS